MFSDTFRILKTGSSFSKHTRQSSFHVSIGSKDSLSHLCLMRNEQIPHLSDHYFNFCQPVFTSGNRRNLVFLDFYIVTNELIIMYVEDSMTNMHCFLTSSAGVSYGVHFPHNIYIGQYYLGAVASRFMLDPITSYV